MTKPAYALCEQQRRRSDNASAQRRLISTFVVRFLDSTISVLAKSETKNLATYSPAV